MAANVGEGMNINMVEFFVTLDNLKEFNHFWTETFHVDGNPWVIKFIKNNSEEVDGNKSFLIGYLFSQIDRTLENWVIVANHSFEIYSNKDNGESALIKVKSHPYFNVGGWGQPLISWDQLMDPERGYVNDDMCNIGFTIKVSPIQFQNYSNFLEFVPVMKCCDATSRGDFQLKIKLNEDYNFFDICSPKFTLKHFAWHLLVCKSVISENDTKEEFLEVQLYNLLLAKVSKMSCKVTLLCKLVSFDTAIEPISNKLKSQELKYLNSSCALNIISWNELMNPQKKFIQNNSFVLQITIIATETMEQETARALERAAKNDKPKAITLECPICFGSLVDQPISVLICGHLFCNECVTRSLQQKRNCPTCNREIPEGELQKVYLPTK